MRLQLFSKAVNAVSVKTTEFYAFLRLLLNAAKTEWIWFGSRVNLARIPERFRSLQVRGSDIECADVVRDLGVYLDSELSM